VQHHFGVHSHQHVVRLDGLLDFRRDRIQICFFFIPRIEIEHGIKQVAQLLCRHLRNVLVEVNFQVGSMRILLGFGGRDGSRVAVCSRNLNVLIPLLAVHRAAVNVEVDVVVFNLHEGDVCRIAGPDCRSPQGQRLLQFRATRRGDAIFQ